VNEWLEQEPPPDVKNIPDSLMKHIKTCPGCRETVGYFCNLAQDGLFPRLSPTETGEFMKKFEKNALADSPSPDPQPCSPAGGFFGPVIKWACAGAFILLLCVIGSSWLLRPVSPGTTQEAGLVAVLRGNATLRSPDGKMEAAGTAVEHALAGETGFAFDEKSGPVELQYRAGGNVYLTGLGEIQVQKDGFRVDKGAFTARFKNLNGVMKVRVPCAVLGVRGTTIRFVIQPPLMEIQLIEGAVDLIPDEVSAKTIRLTVGMLVRLSGQRWSIFHTGSHQGIPGQRSGPEDRDHTGHDGSEFQPGSQGPADASGTLPETVPASGTVTEPGVASDAGPQSVVPGDDDVLPPAPTASESQPGSQGPADASGTASETGNDLIGREGFRGD